jgi:hypothetical protein
VFKQILLMQWRVSRYALALLLPLCIGLPIALVQLSRVLVDKDSFAPATSMLGATQTWVIAFPVLAAATGCAIALSAWAWDHRTHHVYALTLPIERWRYALMKMGAGAIMIGITAVGVMIGALIALALGRLPEGLHGYPFAFAIRFLFASLICYAITFAFAAGTIKTTVRVFMIVFTIFVLGSVLAQFASGILGTQVPTPLELLGDALVTWPGPFNVFGGSWMLIDV